MKKIFMLFSIFQIVFLAFINISIAIELSEGYWYEDYITGLESPTILAFDSAYNLYVARDSGDGSGDGDGIKVRIYKIDKDLNVDLIGPEMQDPDSISIDIDDTIYIGYHDGIYSLLPNGTSSVYEEQTNNNISGVVVDLLGIFSSRSLYIGKAGKSTNQLIQHDGRSLKEFELNAEMESPHALTFDDNKYLYVASSNSVYRISSDGKAETFIEFDNYVESIAFNRNDRNLYIGVISSSSTSENKIYKVSLNAELSLFATGIKAYGIFIDDNENYFVSDRIVVPHRIVKISKNVNPCEGLYTKEEVNNMISKIISWGDLNKDNMIGLEEAIRALIIASGAKDNQ